MKVIHFIPSFGSGGAERQLSLLAPELARLGVEVHVAYTTDGPNLTNIKDSNVHLHQLQSSGNHDPVLAWNIFRLVQRLRPDIVQTWLPQMDILGGLAARLNRIPLIVSERCSADAYSPSWKMRFRRFFGRRSVGIVANSKGGLDYWRSIVPADRLHLVRNCVTPNKNTVDADDSDFALELNHFGSRPLILFAGRFAYQKNIPVLLEAFIQAARQNSEVMFMLFGEGSEQEQALAQIAQAEMSQRILVSGYTSHLAGWMERAAAFVSVSRFEGHPNVVIEAAATGCPLVLSDIGAHREIFDEASAILVPTESSELIANAISDVLKNPVEARARAEKARAITTEYELPKTAAAYLDIYKDITSSKSLD